MNSTKTDKAPREKPPAFVVWGGGSRKKETGETVIRKKKWTSGCMVHQKAKSWENRKCEIGGYRERKEDIKEVTIRPNHKASGGRIVKKKGGKTV